MRGILCAPWSALTPPWLPCWKLKAGVTAGTRTGLLGRLNTAGAWDSDEYSASVICGERVAAGDKSGNLQGRDGVALPERSGHLMMKQKGL